MHNVHSEIPTPPLARRHRTTLTLHNTTLIDYYEWIKNSTLDTQETLDYIQQENLYAQEMMSSLVVLQRQVEYELESGEWPWEQDSIKKSWKQDMTCDTSIFWIQKPYFYWQCSDIFPIYWRQKMDENQTSCKDVIPIFDPQSEPERVLDYHAFIPINTTYFSQGVFEVNPWDPSLVAFSFDTLGTEAFDLYIYNTSSQTLISLNPIKNTYYSVRWMIQDDDYYVYYNVLDILLEIPHSVSKSSILEWEKSEPVYKEWDASLTVEVDQTMDLQLILIKSVGQVTSEVSIITFTLPVPQLIFKRQVGVFYELEHHQGYLYTRTNQGSANNYEIRRFSLESPQKQDIIVPATAKLFITKMEMYQQHLVLWVFEQGLAFIQVYEIDANNQVKNPYNLRFHQPSHPESWVYSVYPGTKTSMEQRQFRDHPTSCLSFSNSSFTHPLSSYTLDMTSKQTFGMTRQPQGLKYVVQERIHVPSLTYSQDRVQIPISLAYLENATLTHRPVVLVGYGAYGGFYPPSFDSTVLPLLKRGVLYAICHARGDADLGSHWYQDGKYEYKINSLLDMGACAKGLVDLGYTLPKKIAFRGRSAGGLLAGAAAMWFGTSFTSLDIFDVIKCVVAEVPFVNAIADMMDPTVPWTLFEYYEWGNPVENKTIFESMLAYSPYENIHRQRGLPNNDSQSLPFVTAPLKPGQKRHFPSLFISGGLYDTRVKFWEPVQFAAKIRYFKGNPPNGRLGQYTQGAPLLLRMYPHGHYSSASQFIQETAEWMSFVLSEIQD